MIAAISAGDWAVIFCSIVGIVVALDILRFTQRQKDANHFRTQLEGEEAGRKQAAAATQDGDDPPTLTIHCDFNPDEVKVLYEIPSAVADLVRAHDPERTFVQCLADLVDPEGMHT